MYTYETIDEQVAYLVGLGYTGTLYDMLLEYYNDETGVVDDDLPDAMYRFLVSLGYEGTIPDMLFENGSFFGTITGNFLLLESGDNILLESGDSLLKE